MNKTVLVTGATGFIGKNLCKTLRDRNYSVIEYSRKDGDISQDSALDLYFDKGITHLYHLAGNTFVPQSWETPHVFLKTNMLGTATALEFCRKNGCTMTYVSAYIYGDNIVNPIREDSGVDPNNPYALSKKMGEDLCKFYNQYFNVCVNIVRPFNIYGTGQSERFLIPFIIKQLRESKEIKVRDLYPKRDYVYIDDVIDVLIKVMEYKAFEIFNVGSGRSYSVKEIIEILLQLENKELPVVSEQISRINEISDTIADIKKTSDLLNWLPKVSIQQGLFKLLS